MPSFLIVTKQLAFGLDGVFLDFVAFVLARIWSEPAPPFWAAGRLCWLGRPFGCWGGEPYARPLIDPGPSWLRGRVHMVPFA